MNEVPDNEVSKATEIYLYRKMIEAYQKKIERLEKTIEKLEKGD